MTTVPSPAARRGVPPRPQFSALTAPRRTTAEDGPSRAASDDRPRRRAPAGPSHDRGRLDAHQRSLLGDLVAGLTAVAAGCVALALLALPSAPVGVGVAAGAVVSLALGWAAVAVWARRAGAAGAPQDATRRHAVAALVLAHAVAAVPVGVAIVLAG